MVKFHPAVIRTLLRGTQGWEPPMIELYQYCPLEYRSCQQVLAMSDPSQLCLEFDEADGGDEGEKDYGIGSGEAGFGWLLH